MINFKTIHDFTRGLLKIIIETFILCVVLCAFVIITTLAIHNWDLVTHQYFKEDTTAHQLIYQPLVYNAYDLNDVKDSCNSTNCKITLNKVNYRNIKDDKMNELSYNTLNATDKTYPESNSVIFDEIIDTTANTISYFSAIIALFALLAGFAMFKYYKKYLTTEDRIRELDKSVLDNALITMHAVPFVEATQITSSKHLDAIYYISRLVKNKEIDVESNPKYAPLLLCQGLQKYFIKRYEDAIIVLKKAEKLLSDKSPYKQIVSFHLARTYKQFAYDVYMNNAQKSKNQLKKAENYLDKASYYVQYSPSWLQNSLELSILEIRYYYHRKLDEDAREKDEKGIKEKIHDMMKNESGLRFSFDRMTALPLYLELKGAQSRGIIEKDTKDTRIGEDFITYMESRISGESGENLMASWYFSMARVCNIIKDYNKSKLYCDLAETYYHTLQNRKNIQTLFTYDCLAEVDKNHFKKQLCELKKELGGCLDEDSDSIAEESGVQAQYKWIRKVICFVPNRIKTIIHKLVKS